MMQMLEDVSVHWFRKLHFIAFCQNALNVMRFCLNSDLILWTVLTSLIFASCKGLVYTVNFLLILIIFPGSILYKKKSHRANTPPSFELLLKIHKWILYYILFIHIVETYKVLVDSIGFWRWCITHRITGFSDFVHRPYKVFYTLWQQSSGMWHCVVWYTVKLS
jgi:hypothetical protein